MLTKEQKQAIEDLYFSGSSIKGIELTEEELSYYYHLQEVFG